VPVAIVVLSDPSSSSDEAFGRVFNALATAYDYRQAGDDVVMRFQGAGTRWVGELEQPDHPAHALFEAVRDTVGGVSSACANAFGATDEALSADVPLLDDNPVPSTSGLPSLRKLIGTVHTVLTF
jgi:DsrE/DsrF-like family